MHPREGRGCSACVQARTLQILRFAARSSFSGQALGSFTHWFMAALMSWTFPMVAARSGGHPFALFAVMMVLQLFWVLWIMPETKGVPLEEIQKKLGIE
ncbi:hypothetical protein LCGC14_2605900 [marine sediment metagenome]|uniref:Major facilitator superfamily (MFS) profile domain-containing protein n=1 Tax=marine sediment metagenome TaxID=412755 RepID=A0A0F9A7M0_9ZZZZ